MCHNSLEMSMSLSTYFAEFDISRLGVIVRSTELT